MPLAARPSCGTLQSVHYTRSFLIPMTPTVFNFFFFFFLLRKTGPELTSVPVSLYSICEMLPQHGLLSGG